MKETKEKKTLHPDIVRIFPDVGIVRKAEEWNKHTGKNPYFQKPK